MITPLLEREEKGEKEMWKKEKEYVCVYACVVWLCIVMNVPVCYDENN